MNAEIKNMMREIEQNEQELAGLERDMQGYPDTTCDEVAYANYEHARVCKRLQELRSKCSFMMLSELSSIFAGISVQISE